MPSMFLKTISMTIAICPVFTTQSLSCTGADRQRWNNLLMRSPCLEIIRSFISSVICWRICTRLTLIPEVQQTASVGRAYGCSEFSGRVDVLPFNCLKTPVIVCEWVSRRSRYITGHFREELFRVRKLDVKTDEIFLCNMCNLQQDLRWCAVVWWTGGSAAVGIRYGSRPSLPYGTSVLQNSLAFCV